jgi:O-antigen/teichoic acid export membrane protein
VVRGADVTVVDPAAGETAVGRVLRNSGWLIGAYALAFGFTFIQNVVLARSLDPAGFGVLAVVISLVTFVQLLLGSRVWEAVTKFVVEFLERGDPHRATATVKLCLLVDAAGAVLGTMLLLILAEPAARVFAAPSAAAPIRLYSLSILVAIPVATTQALLRLADRFRWLAAQTAAENLARLALVVVALVVAGPDLLAITGAFLAAASVAAASLWFLGSRVVRPLGLTPWKSAKLSLLREDRRRILGFLLYSNLSGTARLVTGRVDVLIVGWLTDPASVGTYRLARTVADPLAAVATPVSHAVFPELSKLVHRGDVASVRALTRRIRATGAAVVLPVCLLTTLLAGVAIPWIFGESFSEAVPLTRIMVWQLVWIPFVWVPGLLLSLGRARLLATMTAIDAISYLLLLLALVPAFGAAGAAWATLLRFVGWTAMAAWIAPRVEADLEARVR